ncbi:histidinol-phosphate transaminase [Buchnera aphidicola (Thelaxes californica)]|uniref:Histidinol-phosphate aminotransferase n=1 Tax=Buchnera aphidicola (Thelaxes californica) TaxID=1315998 RepID=A0A4D6YB68_9GAMM|nr:histidinol-phosphate transaminase [Buchnera aphidicola]QCI26639.1 histidinol-phosphate transaminase [Buchnera aphidicola (Thelaxes californica)]
MMFDLLKKITKKNLKNFIPYESARTLKKKGDIWLNANELPHDINIKIQHNMLNRYPENQPKELIEQYAKYSYVDFNNIIITRGADEGIELLMKAFCEPNIDAIITFPPTYPMYKVNAEIMGIQNHEISLINDHWDINFIKIQKISKNIKIIYICRPNNPTGHIIKLNTIIFLLKFFIKTALVVVDEAYIEFSIKNNLSFLINDFPNLVLLRTLSKAFGLAGLRCGFILSNVKIINVLKNIITPYPIASVVSNIAVHFLNQNMIKTMQQRVKKINETKVWFIQQLKHVKYIKKIFNSEGNYVLLELFEFNSIINYLSHSGIVIRPQNDKILLQNHIRISIGTKEDCLEVLRIFKEYSL